MLNVEPFFTTLLQRSIQNPTEHLRWSFLTIFAKSCNLDVLLSSEYASAVLQNNMLAAECQKRNMEKMEENTV